jgi:hypothetical protein
MFAGLSSGELMLRLSIVVPAAVLVFSVAATLQGQDTRKLTEPSFPAVCSVYRAPLTADVAGPLIDPTREDSESSLEAAQLTRQLQSCPAGQAVELALGADSAHNAFLFVPISVPVGVSLIVDGGVTVYASRNPTLYQIAHAPATCGTLSVANNINGVCQPFLTFVTNGAGANNGLYGYGVIDGQGHRPLLVQPTGSPVPACTATSSCTWWDLIDYKDTHSSGYNENNPYTLSAGIGKGAEPANNFTLYKVTVRNPPYHTIAWAGDGFTVWGVHVMAPWTIGNTDGFDMRGTNITLYDTTIANGDDDVAIGAGDGKPTNYVTIRRVATYARAGLTILANGNNQVGSNISNILFEDITQSADVPSLGTNSEGIRTVNGVSATDIKQNWGIDDYHQALPSSSGLVHGIDMRSAANVTGQAPNITDITYRNICMHDVETPIWIDLGGTPASVHPVVSNILYQNIHVLPPTEQLAFYLRGVLQPPSYKVDLAGVPTVPGQPSVPFFHPQLSFSNVVLDDPSDGSGTSISTISAIGTELNTVLNIYPETFNALSAPPLTPPAIVTRGNTTLTLSDNTYGRTAWLSTPRLANPCRAQIPFLTGELFATVDAENSTGLPNQPTTRILTTSAAPAVAANAETDVTLVAAAAAGALLKPRAWTVVKADAPLTLNAVLQPTMSQTTYFMANSGQPQPGRVAIGSPMLLGHIQFYDGLRLVGTASLDANGTLATFRLPYLTPGLHLFTAKYPKDNNYSGLTFGLLAIYATR